MTYYLSTLRHLTAAQIWHRGCRTFRHRWWRLSGKRSPRSTPAKLTQPKPLYQGFSDLDKGKLWSGEISAAIERAQAMSFNRFCFLNQTVGFGDQIRWNAAEFSQLWRYQLHYFDYVRDLLVLAASGERELAYKTFRGLATSWINGNDLLAGDGWHPFTISLRVVNWLHAFLFFSGEMAADGENSDLFLRSAYGQVQILFSDLELDVRGNHLLENLRALIWAGVSFQGVEAEKWLTRGLQLLEKEVAEQILADGGHFERSPGYHLVVCKDLLEIALWLRRNRGLSPVWLDDALQRMRSYLWNILAPDDNVPLLKDSAWDAAPIPQDLLTACALYFDEPVYKVDNRFGLYPQLLFGFAGYERFNQWPVSDAPRGSVALPASGHYVIRDEGKHDYLILDAGKTCPDYLPAHGQADSLTYELMVAGQRIVVDSGVFEYRAGPWRDYFRSTRAHNTVEVAGENQSEVWGSFRVGRRARPGPVFWQSRDEYVLAQGEHDGYRRLRVPLIHQRTILYCRERFWLVVDQLWGEGESQVADHIHLHPELSLKMIDSTTWQIINSRVPLWLKAFGQSSHTIVKGQKDPFRQGWYSEEFGILQENVVLSLGRQAALPFSLGYVIAREVPVEAQVIAHDGGHEVKLVFADHSYGLRLTRGEAPRLE